MYGRISVKGGKQHNEDNTTVRGEQNNHNEGYATYPDLLSRAALLPLDFRCRVALAKMVT